MIYRTKNFEGDLEILMTMELAILSNIPVPACLILRMIVESLLWIVPTFQIECSSPYWTDFEMPATFHFAPTSKKATRQERDPKLTKIVAYVAQIPD